MKKQTNISEQLITDIMSLALEINQTNQHCVYVIYHGHVDLISVSVAKSKRDFNDILYSEEVQLAPYDFYNEEQIKDFERRLIPALNQVKKNLQRTLSECLDDTLLELEA